MFYETAKNNHGLPFNPFKSCVVPRPIGWVSTVSHDGIVNLAPFSMFNQLNYDPPFVCFSGSNRPNTGQRKDSVTNAEETGEFVVNMVSAVLAKQMNITTSMVDYGVDEMKLAGLTPAPSRYVKPPRVAESPIALECKYWKTIEMPIEEGRETHQATVVFGRVVGIHVDDSIVKNGRIDTLAFKPVARLGYSEYTTTENVWRMPRPDDPRYQ